MAHPASLGLVQLNGSWRPLEGQRLSRSHKVRFHSRQRLVPRQHRADALGERMAHRNHKQAGETYVQRL